MFTSPTLLADPSPPCDKQFISLECLVRQLPSDVSNGGLLFRRIQYVSSNLVGSIDARDSKDDHDCCNQS